MKTFDEWFSATYGASFEELWQIPGIQIGDMMRALTKALRDYATYVAQQLAALR